MLAITRFFFVYLNGVKKIVRYTEDFVILRFVISRFTYKTFKRLEKGIS